MGPPGDHRSEGWTDEARSEQCNEGVPVEQTIAELSAIVDAFSASRCVHLVTVGTQLPPSGVDAPAAAAAVNDWIRGPPTNATMSRSSTGRPKPPGEVSCCAMTASIPMSKARLAW